MIDVPLRNRLAMELLFLLALFISDSLAREVDFCHVNDDDPYVYMSTKTAYSFASGGRSQLQPIPNCQPQQIWILARHGTRYPGTGKIVVLRNTLPKLRDQIIDNHEHRKLGRMCNEDLENLKAWSPDPNMREDMAKQVTSQGLEDAVLLARRLRTDFPELLQPNSADLTSENYVFRSTGTKRAQSTLEAFEEGLFGRKDAVSSSATSETDTFLKIYKNCSHWGEGDENDPKVSEERDKFLKSPEFVNLIENVSRRVGFKYDLSAETMVLMYDMCRYDKSWVLTRTSPWCAVFNKEDLKVLEYANDLNAYYGAGYGRKINSELGCFPLQDMFNHFRELERGDTNGKPRGIFYFTHSMTLLSFLASMGIAKDDQMLLSSNYKDMTRRQWRTSYIGPFNANFIAVFYRCHDVNSPNKVMFYLQEKPLLYEGCQVGLCDWEYLKNKLGTIANQCSPELCTTGSGSISHRAMISIMLLMVSLWWI